jgi:hypothetical protein
LDFERQEAIDIVIKDQIRIYDGLMTLEAEVVSRRVLFFEAYSMRRFCLSSAAAVPTLLAAAFPPPKAAISHRRDTMPIEDRNRIWNRFAALRKSFVLDDHSL